MENLADQGGADRNRAEIATAWRRGRAMKRFRQQAKSFHIFIQDDAGAPARAGAPRVAEKVG